eukprot:CAMPEP_0176490564 /NCGR_PEP_ID=MMETSP0200_2-20121128/7941_1 /TAXON_ID=947934 /ORGANISM="Chaetoceros sp., Strain GSL56" /LENGTH=676 /DNA_ID=CAMNT_0017887885 /DNA_START=2968 /DNA_END=4998 /DNA_ORIENTATION=+
MTTIIRNVPSQDFYESKSRDRSSGIVESDDFESILPIMTKKEIQKTALEHSGYSTPSLNDQLYLHYKGYQKIENLEEYVNLKALWLDSNGLQKVENLGHLSSLRCLFLQRNLLHCIENVEGLTSLVQLDISENRITNLDGLDALPNLSSLNVSKNALSTANDIETLKKCKNITCVDFSYNHLCGEDVIVTLSQVPSVLSINMNGNPITSEVAHFRKKMIVANKRLRYLDRPIFDMERASCEAWSIGGRDAEYKAKTEWHDRRKQEEARGMESFRKWQMELKSQAISEKQAIDKFGPTPAQMAKQEERLLRTKERKEKAAQVAAREREIYRLRDLSETKVSTSLNRVNYLSNDIEMGKGIREDDKKGNDGLICHSSTNAETDYDKNVDEYSKSFEFKSVHDSDPSHESDQKKRNEIKNDDAFSKSDNIDHERSSDDLPMLCDESTFNQPSQGLVQNAYDGMKSCDSNDDSGGTFCSPKSKAVECRKESDNSPDKISTHSIVQDASCQDSDASKYKGNGGNKVDSPTQLESIDFQKSNSNQNFVNENADNLNTNCATDHTPLKESPTRPTTVLWTSQMDETLKELTAQHSLDFNNVANHMTQEYESVAFTVDDCRLRWCILVDSECATDTTCKPLKSFQSSVGDHQRASFDELMFGSPIVTVQPSSFPTMDDDSSEEE